MCYENEPSMAADLAAILGGCPERRVVGGLRNDEPPRAAPSIVNADDLGLQRLAAGYPTKEDHQ
jgi:hypothetical protein